MDCSCADHFLNGMNQHHVIFKRISMRIGFTCPLRSCRWSLSQDPRSQAGAHQGEKRRARRTRRLLSLSLSLSLPLSLSLSVLRTLSLSLSISVLSVDLSYAEHLCFLFMLAQTTPTARSPAQSPQASPSTIYPDRSSSHIYTQHTWLRHSTCYASNPQSGFRVVFFTCNRLVKLL
jgi:hypothetical protein